jgi:hypothetical protein
MPLYSCSLTVYLSSMRTKHLLSHFVILLSLVTPNHTSVSYTTMYHQDFSCITKYIITINLPNKANILDIYMVRAPVCDAIKQLSPELPKRTIQTCAIHSPTNSTLVWLQRSWTRTLVNKCSPTYLVTVYALVSMIWWPIFLYLFVEIKYKCFDFSKVVSGSPNC